MSIEMKWAILIFSFIFSPVVFNNLLEEEKTNKKIEYAKANNLEECLIEGHILYVRDCLKTKEVYKK